MEDLTIGIDLGTTNSCVSLYFNQQTKILENSDGGRVTPSFVFFTSLEEAVVGEHAKRIASGKPEDGVYDIKRLVGRKFEDSYIQNTMKHFPFKIEADSSNDPVIKFEKDGRCSKKSPKELCTIILKKLKKDIEEKLGHSVKNAVITVPAYFSMTQRDATLQAAKEAGFTVFKLLNEPTAAALAYFFERGCAAFDYALVYDLGGGTFDVAVLKRDSKNIEIVSVNGDTQLGGQDFDNLIINHVCEELVTKYNYDPRSDKINLNRLRHKCEYAKKALSTVEETVVTLNGFVKDHHCVQVTITRRQFEELGDGLFKRTIDILDRCVKESKVAKNSIGEVILSGGSTRIPKIQKMVSDYFEGKRLTKFVNPDECVAEGAALQAAMLSTNRGQKIKRIKLVDVVPLSLGIEDFVGRMRVIIRRNQRIPTSSRGIPTTYRNCQETAVMPVYEGERKEAKKNRCLGTVVLRDLSPEPPGKCSFYFKLSVDRNGILTAKAYEFLKKSETLKIEYILGDRSQNEIDEAIRDCEENKVADKLFMKFARYKSYLCYYCAAILYNMDKKNLTLTYQSTYDKCDKILEEVCSMEIDREDYIKSCINSLELECGSIVQKHRFKRMPRHKPCLL